MISIIERHVLRTSKLFIRHVRSNAFRFTDDSNYNEEIEKHSTLESDLTVKEQPQTKCLKVAILGAPNAGKSTLINQLVKRNVCAASSKVHTTSCKANAVYTENSTQLVFIDTPGVVSPVAIKRHKLIRSFATDPKQSLDSADVIGLLHDASNRYTNFQISSDILKLIDQLKSAIPIYLILNKVDMLKDKKFLLTLCKHLNENKEYPKFEGTFMISALTGSGVNDMRSFLLRLAKPGNWVFDPTMYTDQTVETLIEKTVRARYLDCLPMEVPYIIQIEVDEAQVNNDGGVMAIVRVICPRNRVTSLALGKDASVVKKVVKESEEILRHALRASVMLKVIVETKK